MCEGARFNLFLRSFSFVDLALASESWDLDYCQDVITFVSAPSSLF